MNGLGSDMYLVKSSLLDLDSKLHWTISFGHTMNCCLSLTNKLNLIKNRVIIIRLRGAQKLKSMTCYHVITQ